MGRRSENTKYLKECICDALIQLMNEAPIEKIRIQAGGGPAGLLLGDYCVCAALALAFSVKQLIDYKIMG